jgi:acetyltransferase
MLDHSATYSVAINPKIRPGNVSVVMQSGAILMGLANSARFGVCYLISCGNQAALEVSDFIGYLAEDEQTKVIVTFIEGIPDTKKFVDALRAAYKAGKPVLLVKVGRSEAAQRAVQAHTGSLAGSDTVLDAVLNREGAIRVNSLDELVETTELFLNCPLPENDGVGLISLSGGQIGLVSDLSQGLGLNFPQFSEEAIAELRQVLPAFTTISNPLDAWGTGDLEKMYPACAEITAAQKNIALLRVKSSSQCA